VTHISDRAQVSDYGAYLEGQGSCTTRARSIPPPRIPFVRPVRIPAKSAGPLGMTNRECACMSSWGSHRAGHPGAVFLTGNNYTSRWCFPRQPTLSTEHSPAERFSKPDQYPAYKLRIIRRFLSLYLNRRLRPAP